MHAKSKWWRTSPSSPLKGGQISMGGEIRSIGAKNNTAEGLQAFVLVSS
jgi:hypothetical protein